MSSISIQTFNSIDDDHKELSLSKVTDFKTKAEILDTWISHYVSKWLEFFLTYIFLCDLKDPKAADPKKVKQRRYDQKTRFDTESSETHNSHKTHPFLLKFWE